jgi:iron complex outermembrane receptor protein
MGGGVETYTAKDLLSGQTTTKSNRFSAVAGIQDTVFLFDRQFQITPGLRFEHVEDELEKATDDMGHPVEPKNVNEHYLMPQLGAKYRVSPGITVKTNVSQYHRIPSFFELFGDRGFFLGNPELKPEKGINADAGVEFYTSLNAWMPGKVTGYGVVFMSRIEDLISRTYDARGIGKSDNISAADILGIECNLNMEINPYVSLTAQYTWQDTTNDSKIKAFNGNRLPGKFAHSWLTRACFNYADGSFTIEYIRENDMYYDTANLLKAETKSEINLDLTWAWKTMVLTLEARNIGNDNYEDFNGYPQPGRSYFCSIKYAL